VSAASQNVNESPSYKVILVKIGRYWWWWWWWWWCAVILVHLKAD